MAERYVWDEIGERTIIKGFHGKFVHSERMTFVLWRFDAGTILPRHQHPHEQVAHVLEGELEITVDGETFTCTPGSVLVIPPNAWHEGIFLHRDARPRRVRPGPRGLSRGRRDDDPQRGRAVGLSLDTTADTPCHQSRPIVSSTKRGDPT